MTGHGQGDHDGPTNDRTHIGDDVEQRTQKGDDDGIFDPNDEQRYGVDHKEDKKLKQYAPKVSCKQSIYLVNGFYRVPFFLIGYKGH